MNILLTNDDGYRADGINYLKKYFQGKGHQVFMVAPDREKSGAGHSITLNDSIRLVHEKEGLWVLKGTPADCVIMGLLGMVPHKIDVVVSGINHGPNIGRDIIYSGTAAAARQGGFVNIPSFALSMSDWHGPFHFESAGLFLDQHFESILQKKTEGVFFNVNIPNIPADQVKGVQQTVPCPKHYYQDDLVYFDAPLQGRYYWVKGFNPVYPLDEGTDAKAVKDGYVSVTPVRVFPEAENIKIL